ncbi:MAG: sensor histidine kinase [Bacteroidota bacterium]
MIRLFRIICIYWLIVNPLNLLAQANVNFDSLQAMIDRYPVEDTVKARMLINFANDIRKTDQTKGISAADQAISIAKRLNQPMLLADAFVVKGANLFNQQKELDGLAVMEQGLQLYEDSENAALAAPIALKIGVLYEAIFIYDKEKLFYLRAEKHYKKTGNKRGLENVYHGLTSCCINLKENTEALRYLDQALSLCQTLDHNTEILIGIYQNYGLLYTNTSNFNKALEYNQKALELSKKSGNINSQADLYMNISGIYYQLKDYQKSLEYDHKALGIYEKLQLPMYAGGVYVNIGTKYRDMADYPKALEYFQKGRSILEPIHAQQFLEICLLNIGVVLVDMKEYDQAYKYLTDATQIAESTGSANDLGYIKVNLGNVINKASDEQLSKINIEPKERKALAEKMVLEAVAIAKNTGALNLLQEAQKVLSEIYEKNGDYVKALSAFQSYVDIRDSISGEDIRQEITRKEIQYEFDKKEANLKFEQQLTQAQLEKQKIRSLQQQQSLQLKEQALALSNKEKDVQHLAFLKEQAEKQKKEQQLNLIEKDRQLEEVQLGSLLQEKALQLKTLAEKNALIGLLIAGILAILLAFAAFYWWVQQKQVKKEAATQTQFTWQLLENIEDDRSRIAIDLHDSVSHDLLLLKQSIRKEFTGSEVDDKIDGIINGIRHISRNLHPVMLDKIGLRLSLETLCEQFMQHETMYVSHQIEYQNTLSKSAELQLFRIVQEGLTNALKYSKAEAVKVEIKQSGNALRLDIQDNGNGFDVEKALDSGKAFGLHSILQRAKAIGGNAEIRSGKDGTTIVVSIP